MHHYVSIGRIFKRHIWPIDPARIKHAAPLGPTGRYFLLKADGPDPFVAIGGAAVLKVNAMQHSVAIIPVIPAQGLKLIVRAVAHVGAMQIGRHFANDLHILELHYPLFVNRGVVAFQIFVNWIIRFTFGVACHDDFQ